mmetsp:Transcript_5347/g.17232  ORF Transcript_5347/g.17232 Transcript_5347/m.17232 type:complete len:242 (+) Transcript_5347:88-813(+)
MACSSALRCGSSTVAIAASQACWPTAVARRTAPLPSCSAASSLQNSVLIGSAMTCSRPGRADPDSPTRKDMGASHARAPNVRATRTPSPVSTRIGRPRRKVDRTPPYISGPSASTPTLSAMRPTADTAFSVTLASSGSSRSGSSAISCASSGITLGTAGAKEAPPLVAARPRPKTAACRSDRSSDSAAAMATPKNWSTNTLASSPPYSTRSSSRHMAACRLKGCSPGLEKVPTISLCSDAA